MVSKKLQTSYLLSLWLFIMGVFYLAAANSVADDDSSNSWRCGIFFAGQNGGLPRAKVYVLPRKFPVADCDAARPGIYNRTCYEVMEKGLKQWDFGSPSRVKPQSGQTIGDDFCGPISKDIGAPGLEIGFYFSYCKSQWIDTGLRTPARLCCSQKKQVPC